MSRLVVSKLALKVTVFRLVIYWNIHFIFNDRNTDVECDSLMKCGFSILYIIIHLIYLVPYIYDFDCIHFYGGNLNYDIARG